MGNLTKNIQSSFDDLIQNKPPEEIEEEKRDKISQEAKLKEGREEDQKISKTIPTPRQQSKTPKGKRIPVTTYFEAQDYEGFEDVRDDLQKAIRRETEVKLKEANVIEIAVLIMMEEFNSDPNKVIKRYSKIVKKMR